MIIIIEQKFSHVAVVVQYKYIPRLLDYGKIIDYFGHYESQAYVEQLIADFANLQLLDCSNLIYLKLPHLDTLYFS